MLSADAMGRIEVDIKVDGVETKVPLRDLIACYQKNTAADNRLREATMLLRAAQSTPEQPPGA